MTRSRKKNPYRKSRRFDKTCRCHGSCPYCRRNRLIGDMKRQIMAEDDIKHTSTEPMTDNMRMEAICHQ